MWGEAEGVYRWSSVVGEGGGYGLGSGARGWIEGGRG